MIGLVISDLLASNLVADHHEYLQARDSGTPVSGIRGTVTSVTSAILSASQLATLALAGRGAARPRSVMCSSKWAIGATRSSRSSRARRAIQDAAGHEIARHGTSGFLGELNLLSGQTAFVTAVVIAPMRYIAVDRDALRALLFDDEPLADLLIGSNFVGAARGAAPAARAWRRMEVCTCSARAHPSRRPDGWSSSLGAIDRPSHIAGVKAPNRRPEDEARALIDARLAADELPLVRLPGGTELRNPDPRTAVPRALGIGLELAPREEVDLLIVGAGPAGLAAAVYGASEGLDTLVVESTALGGQAGSSRRIENYLGFPAGISGTELTSRARSRRRAEFQARTGHALPGASRSSPAPQSPRRVVGGGSLRRRPRRSAGNRCELPTFACGEPGGLRRFKHLLRRGTAGGATLRRHPGRGDRRREFRCPGCDLVGARRRTRDAAASPRKPQRDDVRLPGARARPLRRRRARPQRSRGGARRRRPAPGQSR